MRGWEGYSLTWLEENGKEYPLTDEEQSRLPKPEQQFNKQPADFGFVGQNLFGIGNIVFDEYFQIKYINRSGGYAQIAERVPVRISQLSQPG